VDGGPAPDAALPPGLDGAAGGDAGEAPPMMAGCGCRVAPTRALGAWTLWLAAVVIVARRRRSSRTSRRLG